MTDVIGRTTASAGHVAGAPPPALRHRDRAGDDGLGDLLERAGHGDEAAFAAFYDQTASRAYGLALRILRDAAAAQDVTQESYVHLWLHSARFDPARGAAISWILMIVRGRALSLVRSNRARVDREDRVHAGEVALAPVPVADPAVAVVATDEAGRLRAVVARIPDDQRTAIELVYFDGYTHSEVAALTGVPLGTAKTRVRTGLRALRRLLHAE